MHKLYLAIFIALSLFSIVPANLVLAQDTTVENVTKRRPDIPTNYSPSPAPSLQPAEVKQVESISANWLSKVWISVTSLFRPKDQHLPKAKLNNTYNFSDYGFKLATNESVVQSTESPNLLIAPNFTLGLIGATPVIPNLTLHEYNLDQEMNHSLYPIQDSEDFDPFVEEKYLSESSQPILRRINKAVFSDQPHNFAIMYRTICNSNIITFSSEIPELDDRLLEIDNIIKSIKCYY